jgi:hypothetical protein
MLDLSSFFAKYVEKFVKDLGDKVRSKVDINGRPYSPIKPSTAGAIVSKKTTFRKGGKTSTKIVRRSSNSRLNYTGNFAQNFVVGNSGDYSMTVEVNPANYPGSKVSYRDIVAYNDQNSDEVNPEIINPPSIFPTRPEDLDKLQAMDQMKGELEEVLKIQLGEELAKTFDYQQTITIG